jgi:nucleoside-diphosphate-sugar epimerase
VRALGGTPFIGDVREARDVRPALVGCGSVIHVAAAYPRSPPEEAAAHQVRVDGARTLAQSAKEVGTRRMVLGSGYWVYADGRGVLTDDSPLDPRGESRVNFDAEEAARAEARPDDLEVLVVRPGMVYGDGSWFRGMVDSLREGTYQLPGRGENYWSLVERGDAAAAFQAVLEKGKGGRTYLVVDNAPIPLRDLVTLLVHELRLPFPPETSPERLRAAVGEDVAHHLEANRRGSNARLRALGWDPRFPDCRIGIPPVLRAMKFAGIGSP